MFNIVVRVLGEEGIFLWRKVRMSHHLRTGFVQSYSVICQTVFLIDLSTDIVDEDKQMRVRY